MIKVRHSKHRRTILLELSGELGSSDAARASSEVVHALNEVGKGYALIEAFRGGTTIPVAAVPQLSEMVSLCYLRSRIWRVVRVFVSGGQDPGLCILHRTRWDRCVPMTDADTARLALAMAEEEVKENAEWSYPSEAAA